MSNMIEKKFMNEELKIELTSYIFNNILIFKINFICYLSSVLKNVLR